MTYKSVLVLVFISCISLSVLSQTFSANVDRDKILLGEQIRLVLKAEGLRAGENNLRSWISFPDTFNHLEVVDKSKIDTINVNNALVYQQTITLTSFDSGQWTIPALRLTVQANNSNRTAGIASLPITINVLPVDVSHMQDYHDIKDILQVQNPNSRWILIAVIALTVISIIAIYLLLKRKRKVVVKPIQLNGNQTPIEWALSELAELQKEDLPGRGLVKQYYLQLTNICRQFFAQQLQQKALYQTSDEWMVNLQSLAIDQDTKTEFFQFVRLADTVKFAKYLPSPSAHHQSMKISKEMLLKVVEGPQTRTLSSKTNTV
jgi:hypothetical protein